MSEVVGMKITFFAIFDPTWIHIWPHKAQIWNSLNRILIFYTLERQKLYIITKYVP